MKVNLDTLPETTLKAIDLQFRNTRKVTLKNKTTSFSYDISKRYMSSTFTNTFRASNKNSYCESNIYLNLPDTETDSNLFHEDEKLNTLIKDPFWITYKLRKKEEFQEIQLLLHQ